MIDANELKAYYYAEPFEPIEIVLIDGRHIIVKEREHFGWSTEARILMFPASPDVVDSAPFSNVIEVRPVKRGGSGGRRKAS